MLEMHLVCMQQQGHFPGMSSCTVSARGDCVLQWREGKKEAHEGEKGTHEENSQESLPAIKRVLGYCGINWTDLECSLFTQDCSWVRHKGTETEREELQLRVRYEEHRWRLTDGRRLLSNATKSRYFLSLIAAKDF